ncbi:hypothetical protein B0T16DRAFT_488261 [Cercophora newfieldiana]|uniref:Uncharacterized protein n=1 Tax=Cercophora newfieldiana TaxID=92897 RepID=A0AA40D1R8_9PEZI|nr:hypothetical protein B0T16DRAFT_488261 [Cercophora newfieldiana]
MDPPVSPQASSTGLVRAGLQTSWLAWTTPSSQMQADDDEPEAVTPFHPLSDMTYFEDPPASEAPKAPPRRKKGDHLGKILKTVGGFGSSPEPENNDDWSPPSLEDLLFPSQPSSYKIQDKRTKENKVHGGTREAENDHHHSNSSSRKADQATHSNPAPDNSSPTNVASNPKESVSTPNMAVLTKKSPPHRSSSATTKAEKRKAEDAPTPDEALHISALDQQTRQRQQKTQGSEADQASKSNSHAAKASEGNRKPKRAAKKYTTRVCDSVDEQVETAAAPFCANETSDPVSRMQESDPKAVEDQTFWHQDPVEIIEINSDDEVMQELPVAPTKQGKKGTSNAPAAHVDPPAPPPGQKAMKPNLGFVSENECGDSSWSRRKFDHTVLTSFSDEPRAMANSIFSGARNQPGGFASIRGGGSDGSTFDANRLPSVGENVPDTPAPFQDDGAGCSANSSLGLLFSDRLGSNTLLERGAGVREPTDHRYSAPETVWKQAVADDSLPMVMRQIVSTLHRSLKSKEDVVDGIAKEYQENAVRLIRNLRSRHTFERTETFKAHETASQEILATFVAAERDMGEIIEQVKSLDAGQVAASVRHQGFIEKLDLICQLYAKKSQKSMQTAIEKGSAGDGLVSDNEQDEALISEFQSKLDQKVRHADSKVERDLEKLHAKAEMLLRGVIPGVKQKTPPQPVHERPKKPQNTFYDIMEGGLDTMISDMQQPLEGGLDENVGSQGGSLTGSRLSGEEKGVIFVPSDNSDPGEDDDFK